jgi:hypothetical protein
MNIISIHIVLRVVEPSRTRTRTRTRTERTWLFQIGLHLQLRSTSCWQLQVAKFLWRENLDEPDTIYELLPRNIPN